VILNLYQGYYQGTRLQPGDRILSVDAKPSIQARGRCRPTAPAARGKLGRHYWRNPPVALDAGQWERLPDRLGIDPARYAESAGIVSEVRQVVDDDLTAHQRRVFVAIVVDGIPLDTLAARLGLQRNALYKVIFDARRLICRALVANGHLEEPGLEQR
jgi:RNA polymerase sigma-70 factor, ECF subfamily